MVAIWVANTSFVQGKPSMRVFQHSLPDPAEKKATPARRTQDYWEYMSEHDVLACHHIQPHEARGRPVSRLHGTGEARGRKNINQATDGAIPLLHVDAVECLEYQILEKHKRKAPNMPLNEAEISDFSALIGSMGWAPTSWSTRPSRMSWSSQLRGSLAI